MTTIITTPNEITDILFEGEMEPDVLRGKPSIASDAGKPAVALGKPVCLGKFGVNFNMPKGTEALLEQNDYYLVRLACSFRPPHGGKLTFAALSAYLRPTGGDAPVTAFDLFPKQVAESQEREITVGVKPGLNLAQVGEIELGGIETVVKYSRLEPVIIGIGAGRSDPGWEFSAHEKHPLLGSKFLYLIVEKPPQVEAVRLTLHVTAEVETKQGLFSATIRSQDRDHLSSVICAD
jgi:hypothetical protein